MQEKYFWKNLEINPLFGKNVPKKSVFILFIANWDLIKYAAVHFP